MQFVIHVAPQNLRESETENRDDLPVWVVRPVADLTQTFTVAAVRVLGTVESCTTRHEPLPDTAGHGWAYLRTSANAVCLVRKLGAAITDWVQAETLFTGVCCIPATWTRASQTIPANDHTSDDAEDTSLYDAEDIAEDGETADQSAFDSVGSVAGVGSQRYRWRDPLADHISGPSW